MNAKNPRAGKGARASVSIAADIEVSKAKAPAVQPYSHRYKVIVAPGIWRHGYVVSTQPQSLNHLARTFADNDLTGARAFAMQLSALEGWPIVDRTRAHGEAVT